LSIDLRISVVKNCVHSFCSNNRLQTEKSLNDMVTGIQVPWI